MSAATENQYSFTPKSHISISRVDHNTSIMKSVDDIFQKQLFTDVCLSCENQIINAHRLILAASTSFFHSLFSSKPCCLNPNPVIVIRDMKINELKAILEFIYYGNITIPENELDSLIKSAESLGVYGLSKLNPDQINELEDNEDQPHEINNNSISNSKSTTSLKGSPQQLNNKEQSTKSGFVNKSNQSNKTPSPATNSSNKSSTEKNPRRKILNDSEDTLSKKSHELEQLKNRDTDEKRKKRELINLLTDDQIAQSSFTKNESTSQQSASKRQSLRIRYRSKSNTDASKDTTDILNTSNNSEISLSDALAAASNGKRLKHTNSDSNLQGEDDLMSADDSEFNIRKGAIDSYENASEETAINSASLLSASKMSAMRAFKLKRSKNSILKKQMDQTKQFKLMLGKTDSHNISKLELHSEALTDDEENGNLANEESVVLKKTDSPANSSLNTSRKSSIDSNSGSLLRLNRSTNDKQQDDTAISNQSLLATSSQSQQKNNSNKKKRRISIDNST